MQTRALRIMIALPYFTRGGSDESVWVGWRRIFLVFGRARLLKREQNIWREEKASYEDLISVSHLFSSVDINQCNSFEISEGKAKDLDHWLGKLPLVLDTQSEQIVSSQDSYTGFSTWTVDNGWWCLNWKQLSLNCRFNGEFTGLPKRRFLFFLKFFL